MLTAICVLATVVVLLMAVGFVGTAMRDFFSPTFPSSPMEFMLMLAIANALVVLACGQVYVIYVLNSSGATP